MKACFRVFFPLGVCVLLASTAWSQTGNIRGTVTDETGAVLPGATVTIRSEAIIGGSREQVTNELGVYRFISIPIGTYDVEATLASFETKRIEAVRVALDVLAPTAGRASAKAGVISEIVPS